MRTTKAEKIASLINSIIVNHDHVRNHAPGSKQWYLWMSAELDNVIALYDLGIVLPEIRDRYDQVVRDRKYYSDQFHELCNKEKERA